MKNIIRKSILFCAIVAGNMWAMEEEKSEWRSVEVTVRSDYKDWFNFRCSIGMKASRQENIDERLLSYFGVDPETNIPAEKRSYKLTKNIGGDYTLTLPEQQYDRLSIIKANLIRELVQDLHTEKQSSDEINRLLANRAGWTDTTFGKHSLESAIIRFFDENIQSCEMHSVLAALDGIARVIQDNKLIDAGNKKVWQEIIDAANTFFEDRISFKLFNEKLLAEGADEADEAKELGLTAWVIRQVDLQGMQFLAYALEHARENSEHKSLIIGSWFNEKLSTLTPEQLNLIIERVNLWLGHYQAIPKHFENIRDEKQQVEASLVRSALLKKAGWGVLAIGVSVAAYQLYQYLYNTPADEQPETAQA